MKKTFTLGLFMVMMGGMPLEASSLSLVNQVETIENGRTSDQRPKREIKKLKTRSAVSPLGLGTDGLLEYELLKEDFSKFTAGSEEKPDTKRLENQDGLIDDGYFNTPGWSGYEIFQAGGAAYIGYSEEYGETGMLITPTVDMSGAVTIKLRAKSISPEGDYFNYNIVDAEMNEVIDGNALYIGNEWTDVEFTSTYGTASSYLYLFTEAQEVFVDDVMVNGVTLEIPVLHEESNVNETGFTASWDNVPGAEVYDVYAFADHPVGEDGICLLAELDFANMQDGGTENNPEVDYENTIVVLDTLCANDFPGWYLYMPAYVKGMAAVSGHYASYEEFGYLSSPEMDLSGDNGKVTITLNVKAGKGERVAFGMLSLTDMGYQFVDSQVYETAGEWEKFEVELSGGTELSYVQIIYGGTGVMLIDDVKMTQKLPAGTVKHHKFLANTTEKTSVDVVVPERYRGDKVCYSVRSVKYLWETMEGYTYQTGAIESDFTAIRYVELPTAIFDVQRENELNGDRAYDLQGRVVDVKALQKGSLYIQSGRVRVK